MTSPAQNSTRKLRNLAPFLVGFVVFLFISWGIYLVVTYPDDGIRVLSPTNEILEIDTNLRGQQPLQVGDKILEVNGVPIARGLTWYEGRKAGDSVEYLVNRNGYSLRIQAVLASPSFLEVIRRVVPLAVSLVYLAIAMWIGAYAPSSNETSLCYWFFLIGSAILATGQISGFGHSINNLYNFLFWMVGPLSVHFHFYFPQETKLRFRRVLLGVLYLIGLSGGIPNLVLGTNRLRENEATFFFIPASRYFLAINLMLVVWLLYDHYHHAGNTGVKSKIRIVLLGGLLTAIPFVSLYILPEALIHKPIQPYYLAFIWLSVLPLTYGYAIFRYRLIEFEHHINRGATVLLVFSILVGIYLTIYSVLQRLLPGNFLYDPALNTLLILILSTTILPISRQVQKVVDTMFYGGWYDYRSAILQITSGLEQITDLRELASITGERLVKTLRIEDACIFFSDIEGDFSVVEVAPKGKILNIAPVQLPPLPRSSLEFLLKIGGDERASIAEALKGVKLSPEEHELLNTEQVHLWVPVISHSQVKGLLALGPKFGGDIFSAEDMDILRVVSRNLGPVIENIHLLNQLRKYAADLEQRVQERTSELYDAKERVEAILASVGDGVVVTDLNGKIEIVNQAMEKQSQYTSGELKKRNIFEWLASYNDDEVITQIKDALSRGEVWSGELMHGKKNGNLYDVLLTIAPVRDQNKKVVNYVATQRDITYRKELDRLKDIFVADVSHELRTPTTNIGLYVELLEGASDSKRDEYLQILKEQSQLLRRLVEDILDLSRLAIGKTKKIEFSEIDLRLLVEQALTAHYPAAEKAGIELKYEVSGEIPALRGDMSRLSRVVNNLLSNAIQYTPQGWVKILLRPMENYVCMEVKDTGMGISEEDLPHIFERFFRGQQVRQSKRHGTGLGLAIVREIVELHNGKIDVESKLSEGSTFRVYLPISE